MIDETTHTTDTDNPRDWVTVSRAELERLRGIERAIRSIARGADDKPEVDFRHMATLWHDIGWPFRARVCSAIADALEAKP